MIGLKRHHSYDEVMTASVGIGVPGGEKLIYFNEESYQDLLQSTDPEISEAAQRALSSAAAEFIRAGNRSVLETICNSKTLNAEKQQAFRAEMNTLVKHYYDVLIHPESVAADFNRVRKDMVNAIRKYLPHTAEFGPKLQTEWDLSQRSARSAKPECRL